MKRQRVLIIDESSGAALPLGQLGLDYAVSHERVASAEALHAALAREPWDLVIGQRAVRELAESSPVGLAADRLASVGALAAGIAHEINNPLASVIANLDLCTPRLEAMAVLLRENPHLAQLRDQLADAGEAARRVQSVVRDLKVFAHTDEEKHGPTDVRAVLESVARLASTLVRSRARLIKDFGDVPLVDANEGRLGQAFLNVVINAAEALPAGRPEHHEIRLSAVTISEGRVLVEILGGEISVGSKPGSGSVFKLVLPASAGDPGRPRPLDVPAQSLPSARRGRVLAVDDEPMMVKVIQRMLSLDHEVSGSIGAQQALDWIRAGQRFDVILCDLMMPSITGMDFHAELTRCAPDQAKRVIFLTGGAFTPVMRAFLEVVGNLRLEKPFDPPSLRAIVNARVAAATDD